MEQNQSNTTVPPSEPETDVGAEGQEPGESSEISHALSVVDRTGEGLHEGFFGPSFDRLVDSTSGRLNITVALGLVGGWVKERTHQARKIAFLETQLAVSKAESHYEKKLQPVVYILNFVGPILFFNGLTMLSDHTGIALSLLISGVVLYGLSYYIARGIQPK